MMADEPAAGDHESVSPDRTLSGTGVKRWAAQLLGPVPVTEHTPIGGDHELFSRDEIVAAFSLLVTPRRAKRFAAELLEPAPPGTDGLYSHFGDDVLDLLSLVSDDCAERVRGLFGITAEKAAERRTAVRTKLKNGA